MTYAAVERLLFALPRFAVLGRDAMKPGLERIRALLSGMGSPDRKYRSVQVAGTNGKGSTASMLSAILTAGGARVGLHTSPHLLYLGERMRVDGAPAPREWLAETVARHARLIDDVSPSFFEATVALSLLYFADREVDVAVVEVGLGGRLDATSAISPDVGLITRIALDHADILGPNLEDIAREKAGIARAGVPLLTTVEAGPLLSVIETESHSHGANVEAVRHTMEVEPSGALLNITSPEGTYSELHLDLAGEHQVWNAALALRACEVLNRGRADLHAVKRGLSDTVQLSGIRGRCEVVHRDPVIAVDVAHNADGVQAALSWFRSLGLADIHVALGVMKDKDVAALAAVLDGDLIVHPLAIDNERALPAAALYDELRSAGVNVSEGGRVWDVARQILDARRPGAGLLVTGSHQVVAQLLDRPGGQAP